MKFTKQRFSPFWRQKWRCLPSYRRAFYSPAPREPWLPASFSPPIAVLPAKPLCELSKLIAYRAPGSLRRFPAARQQRVMRKVVANDRAANCVGALN
jgi:hypothetical protein